MTEKRTEVSGQCQECATLPDDGLCDPCAERMKERMARAFGKGLPEPVKVIESGDPIRDWAERRGASMEARLEAEAEWAYWAAGLGCALNLDVIREGETHPIMEDYCVFDIFCPLYEAGCRDMLDNPHENNR
jgi:hypothetical protein